MTSIRHIVTSAAWLNTYSSFGYVLQLCNLNMKLHGAWGSRHSHFHVCLARCLENREEEPPTAKDSMIITFLYGIIELHKQES